VLAIDERLRLAIGRSTVAATRATRPWIRGACEWLRRSPGDSSAPGHRIGSEISFSRNRPRAQRFDLVHNRSAHRLSHGVKRPECRQERRPLRGRLDGERRVARCADFAGSRAVFTSGRTGRLPRCRRLTETRIWRETGSLGSRGLRPFAAHGVRVPPYVRFQQRRGPLRCAMALLLCSMTERVGGGDPSAPHGRERVCGEEAADRPGAS
jgi:hypothetical protein